MSYSKVTKIRYNKLVSSVVDSFIVRFVGNLAATSSQEHAWMLVNRLNLFNQCNNIFHITELRHRLLIPVFIDQKKISQRVSTRV